MSGSKHSRWAILALAAGLLVAPQAHAWQMFGFGQGPVCDGSVTCYSPCHYNFPVLWRLKAHWCGLPGMPVSVYPPAPAFAGCEVAQPGSATTPTTSADSSAANSSSPRSTEADRR